MIEAVFPTKLDFKGHFGYRLDEFVDLLEPSSEARFWQYKAAQIRPIFDVLKSFPEGEEYDSMRQTMRKAVSLGERCTHCGERVRFNVVGDKFVAASECKEAGGLKPYEHLIHVPSGKIVFANDLRPLIAIPDDDCVSRGGTFGMKVLGQRAENRGLAIVFVGNTCPAVVKDGGELHVGVGFPKTQRVGVIDTSWWWYSAMDHEFFLQRCSARGFDPEDFENFSVDVKPGVYAFTNELADTHADEMVFSKIRKVDVEPPVIVIDGVDDAKSLMDSQFWQGVTHREQAFTGRLADMFFTIGSGYDWINGGLRAVNGRDDDDEPYCVNLKDRKGTRTDDRIPLLPDVAVPDLYPPSWEWTGKLGIAPANIDPYWLASGMMFLKTVLGQPVKPIGWVRRTDEQLQRQIELSQAIFGASLDLLCEIADERDLWADGKLERVFDELVEAFTPAA